MAKKDLIKPRLGSTIGVWLNDLDANHQQVILERNKTILKIKFHI